MGFSPGEESHPGGVAAQTIEAQPVFGQIKPSRGQVRPRRTAVSGRRHGRQLCPPRRSTRSSVEKGAACRRRRSGLCRKLRPNVPSSTGCAPNNPGTTMIALGAALPKMNLDVRASPRSERYANRSGEGLSLARRGRGDWLGLVPACPARLWTWRCQDGDPCPGRSCDENRADAGADLTPQQRWHTELR